MGLNILDLLLPREVKFYKYLNDQADIFHKNCLVFKNLIATLSMKNEDEIRMEVGKIKELELKGDRIERFIIRELNMTFITPLDREDIHMLTISVDKSHDFLNSVAQKIEIYKIKKAPKNVLKFAEIIVDISLELKKLISALKTKKDIEINIKRIHALENEADHLFHTSLAELFSDEKQTVDIVKFKDIYQNLEDVVNSVESVAKMIRGIVVKQG